jgi:mannose-1-phosphate guanylyltransferase / mannose-6-phosphate isomerase
VILEPVGRNTAPAIALAAKYAMEKMDCGDNETIFVSPSDHLIEPVDRFLSYVRLSDRLACQGHLVTFGIKPARPETGYGYIKADALRPIQDGSGTAYGVDGFVEKPDAETAGRYVADGSYYWNSGMFAFSNRIMNGELAKYEPAIGEMTSLGYDDMVARFEAMPSISIDYAVMEKSSKVAVIPAELSWNDVGSWDSVFDGIGMGEDETPSGNVIKVDSEGTVVVGEGRVIAAVGVRDCVIVDTPDALLVIGKGGGQKVKNVTDRLVATGRKEASEHTTIHRPWGNFTNVLETEGYKVKRIVVHPGGKLSLQFHRHRSEHWIVTKGKAEVTVGNTTQSVNENESIYIPSLTQHRLENCGALPLELIEVQYGDYLGEDDIVRLEDIYGRAVPGDDKQEPER